VKPPLARGFGGDCEGVFTERSLRVPWLGYPRAIADAKDQGPSMSRELPTRIFRTEEELSRLAASDRIRYRLVGAQRRYHANDNIADFINEGELDELRAEVEAKMQEVLHALVIDTQSDHNTQETARRVAKMFITEVFSGRYRPMPTVTEFPNAERLNELMIVGPIKVRSACSHHLCPIMGQVWIGILPNEHSNLIGLSKYSRICDWIMSRPQIQEEAVTMLANELQERVKPDGLAIVMEADHFCMHWRGVKDDQSMMTNSVMRGAFLKNPNLRREFLSLLSKKV
jgi:GTP cyclohydrolase IA